MRGLLVGTKLGASRPAVGTQRHSTPRFGLRFRRHVSCSRYARKGSQLLPGIGRLYAQCYRCCAPRPDNRPKTIPYWSTSYLAASDSWVAQGLRVACTPSALTLFQASYRTNHNEHAKHVMNHMVDQGIVVAAPQTHTLEIIIVLADLASITGPKPADTITPRHKRALLSQALLRNMSNDDAHPSRIPLK